MSRSSHSTTLNNAVWRRVLFAGLQDIRRQLYTDEDDRTIFGWIQSEVRSVEQRLENGRAVLQHLEMQLINVACDDPGATVGTQLVLPMLRERLDAKAHEFAERCAAELRNARVEVRLTLVQLMLSQTCSSLINFCCSQSGPASDFPHAKQLPTASPIA